MQLHRSSCLAASAAALCCARPASSSRHSSRASEVITAYKSPVPVSLQASNTGPRQPGQMPNENSGNAACSRTSSARIHGGAACLPRSSDLVSSARPQSYQCACPALSASWPVTGGVSSSPAATGSARLPDVPGALAFHAGTPDAFGLAAGQRPDCPGPPRAVELPPVPTAGQADIVPVVSTAHAATIADMSLRTHYTRGSHGEMARKLLIAPSHMGAGAEQDRRNAMRPSAFDPPAIPPAFRERPDVCQALRQRDMSTLFRLLQQYLGLSQMRIGTAVGLGQGRMSEVINGIRTIRDVKVFERIADGLDMPDHARVLLGLTPRQITAPPPRSPVATSGQDAGLLRQITAAGRIDATVVRVLQGETDNIRLLDRRLGAPAVAGKLEAHIGQIETSLRYSLRPGNRQQLARALADAAALAGWQAIDMNRLPRAWAHFERATAAAREAADPCLLAFAAGEQAYVLLDLHRPAEALAMVRAAYEETRAAVPHQVRSWLRAAEAEMAAAAGEESICRRALDGAAQEISYGAASEDLPYLALNETHLARWRGNCLVMFGDPQTADDLAAALAAMEDGFIRAEASLRCDLAAALHVRGEHDEAKQHLKTARELAQLTGSARQRRRVLDLSRRIAKAA